MDESLVNRCASELSAVEILAFRAEKRRSFTAKLVLSILITIAVDIVTDKTLRLFPDVAAFNIVVNIARFAALYFWIWAWIDYIQRKGWNAWCGAIGSLVPVLGVFWLFLISDRWKGIEKAQRDEVVNTDN